MARNPIRKTSNPALFLDVLYEDGQFFFLIQNTTDAPIYQASIEFDKKILGRDGQTNLAALKIFRKIETLAPRKTIRIFIDRRGPYFARRQPAVFTVTIGYRDAEGTRFTSVLKHDLSIYKDLDCDGVGGGARR